jgi:hypothetical protein
MDNRREKSDQIISNELISPPKFIPTGQDEVKEFFNDLMFNPVDTLKNTTGLIIEPFVKAYNYLATPNFEKSK